MLITGRIHRLFHNRMLVNTLFEHPHDLREGFYRWTRTEVPSAVGIKRNQANNWISANNCCVGNQSFPLCPSELVHFVEFAGFVPKVVFVFGRVHGKEAS